MQLIHAISIPFFAILHHQNFPTNFLKSIKSKSEPLALLLISRTYYQFMELSFELKIG